MLRFAYWAGLGGFICSLGLALLAWSAPPLASHAAPYVALFLSIFITFAPAILGHPARTRSGGKVELDWSALAVAEPWTLGLAIATFIAMCAAALWLSPGDHHSIETASLIGRVDRRVTLCAFFATFHSFALCIASSGLRWGLRSTSATPTTWFGKLLHSKPSRQAPAGLPGAPLTYRTANVGWGVIVMEFLGSFAAIVFAGNELSGFLRLPHVNLLALVLLIVPFWHLFLKSCGHVTFVLEGDSLLTQHFPFGSRNRRIPLADIRGIQVNAELDDEGRLTHYSLLLIRDRASIDRLVDHLPSAEHARALSQQIDALLRVGTARFR